MSSTLGRIFHRRDASNTTTETVPTSANAEALKRSGSQSHRRDAPRRSFGDFVRSRSRSLSRSRTTHRRHVSEDVQSSTVKRQSGKPPERPPRDNLPTDYSLLTLQATGPSVPQRKSSLHMPHRPTSQRASHGVIINTPLMPAEDPYSEKVADWNLRGNEKPSMAHTGDWPAPLQVPRHCASLSGSSTSQNWRYDTPWDLAHKPAVDNLRNRDTDLDEKHISALLQPSKRDVASDRRRVARLSLEKPLPEVPDEERVERRHDEQSRDIQTSNSILPKEPAQQHSGLTNGSHVPIDLSEVADLTVTEDTAKYVKWAPAVTKETRIVNSHEIRKEVITREIHNHHVYHRVLPVIDVEVLPSRHFVPIAGGGYKEISRAEIPGGDNSQQLERLIHEAVTKMLPEKHQTAGPRHFTARKFEGSEGDYREYTTPDGVKHSEQWWVHPPVLETGGQQTGQTQAFHFNSDDPRDDGLRESTGNVPRVNKQTSSGRAEPSSSASADGIERPVTPPRPSSTHTVLPIRMRSAESAGVAAS